MPQSKPRPPDLPPTPWMSLGDALAVVVERGYEARDARKALTGAFESEVITRRAIATRAISRDFHRDEHTHEISHWIWSNVTDIDWANSNFTYSSGEAFAKKHKFHDVEVSRPELMAWLPNENVEPGAEADAADVAGGLQQYLDSLPAYLRLLHDGWMYWRDDPDAKKVLIEQWFRDQAKNRRLPSGEPLSMGKVSSRFAATYIRPPERRKGRQPRGAKKSDG